jgi:hypothetical protein
MQLPQFLDALFDSGRVTIGHDADEVSLDDRKAARLVLLKAEEVRRLEVPGEPPVWDEASGVWAAGMFFRACQFSVLRHFDAETIRQTLSATCPAEASAARRHYSVDLVFRYLPDLHTLAREASRTDPLVEILEGWGAEWPLSSVGMKNVPAPQVEPLTAEPVLLRYYAERIIARRDRTRLADPRVAEAVRAQFGMHHGLVPEIWEALK